MSLAMSKAEREQFLMAQRVGIVSVVEPGRGPLTLPIWYAYEDGEVRFLTGAQSRKATLIRQAGRVSLCVQNETPPYQYVSVEGAVTIGAPDFERDERAMAYRYLGQELGDWYLQVTAEDRARGTILVRLRPERWLTVDYSKMPR